MSQADPNKALREAVVAMASARPRRASNRNPIYKKPSPARSEWIRLAGLCDSIAAIDIELALSGPHDEADRLRNWPGIVAAAEKLKGIAA